MSAALRNSASQASATTRYLPVPCAQKGQLQNMSTPRPMGSKTQAGFQAMLRQSLPEEYAGRADRQADDEQAHRLWPTRDQRRKRREAHQRPAHLAASQKRLSLNVAAESRSLTGR